MKVQYRIALIFTLLTIGIIMTLNVIDYYWILQNTSEDFYKRLELRTALTANLKQEDIKVENGVYKLKNINLEKLPSQKEYFIPESRLNEVLLEKKLPLTPIFFKEILQYGKARYRNRSNYYAGRHFKDANIKYFVVVSARNEAAAAYLRNSKNVVLISVVVAIIISSILGFFFSKILLRPIQILTEKMQDITATQLHLRLPTNKSKDEMAMLSETFNNMLDRLETTFETQKNFISNASHELNTPLTTIIGESEYILNKPRSQEEYVGSLQTILCEAERLKKITNSLLHLAQTGYNGKIQEFKRCRIDEIIFRVKEIVDDIIPDNKLVINLDLIPEDQNKLKIRANGQLLEIAFTNIIINACKYSSNQEVQLTLAATRDQVMIIVEDHGIGIPETEIDYIYEPFFRASNTSKFNGYGIGLPLTRNIIRMHHGELKVASIENVGTKIKIVLPLSQ